LQDSLASPIDAVRQPRHSPWLIAVVVAMAAFMEVLDTSIANVALPYMAGSLGASNDQSTWVLTSYLVSNAVVLPMSGWLADFFGRKRFFMTCLVLFTASSFFCGVAPSLNFLIVARVAHVFPPEQRGLAFAL
jgi:DHA2 family multidrug resistance protein